MDVLKTRCEPSEVLAWRRKTRRRFERSEELQSRRKIRISETMTNSLTTTTTSNNEQQINERVVPLVEQVITTSKVAIISHEANKLATTRSLSLNGGANSTNRRTCGCSSTAAPKMQREFNRSQQARCNIGMLLAVGTLVIIISLTFAGAVDSAPEQDTRPVKSGSHQEEEADNGLQATNPTFNKRQLSSAELPAEFRGGGGDADEQPREQSRLAKLCQQTSSVLASVLPAPFGGHKRSILCQFFGQVHVPNNSNGAKLNVGELKKQQNNGNKYYPIGGVSPLPAHLIAGMGSLRNEPESIAILHQQQQPPVALIATGKHPIQLVLEHQQRQAAAAAAAAAQVAGRSGANSAAARTPVINLSAQQSASIQQAMSQQNLHDLKSAHKLPQQRQAIKFSAPLAGAPQPQQSAPILVSLESSSASSPSSGGQAASMPSSSTGWRIFNATLLASERHELANLTTSPLPSTTATPTLAQSKQSEGKATSSSTTTSTTTTTTTTTTSPNVTSKQAPVYQRPKTVVVGGGESMGGARQLQIGKRTSEPPSITNTTTNSSNSTSSRQSAIRPIGSDEVRTIEVMGQSASGPAAVIALLPMESKPSGSQSKPPNETSAPPDSRQSQKREELVIASINNLTRIAFGNQLRDTVKVINKLIDQQAGLFESSSAKTKSARQSTSLQSDPMQVSESISSQSQVALNSPREKVTPSQSGGKFALAKTRKLETAKVKQVDKDYRKQQQRSDTSQDKVTLSKGKPTTSARSSAAYKSTTKANKPAATPTRSPSRGSAKFSSSSSSSSTTQRSRVASRQQSSSVVVAPTMELKRLTTISRALTFDQGRQSASSKSATRRTKGPESWPDDELRASSSSWMPSSGGPSTKQAASSGESARLATVTQFPWLLPDKSAADLFGSSSGVSLIATSDDIARTTATPQVEASEQKKFTARRMISSSGASSQRLEPKQDSLTTLKMALSRSKALAATSLPPPASTPAPGQLIAVQSTRLPFSSGAQSRWIPSTVYVTRAPGSTTHKPPAHTSLTKLTTTAKSTTTSTTTTTPSATTTPMASSTPASDLNELRASDTISRYTTHLIGEANELMATTRRHFPQQLPQIANTGDFFSAETIASWPEKYHSMMSQATESQPHERATTSSFASSSSSSPHGSTSSMSETTRRNGDAYEMTPIGSSTLMMASTQPADQQSGASSTTLARHRLDDNSEATAAQTAASSEAQSVAYIMTNSPGITILPANHKLTPSTAAIEQSSATHQSDTPATVSAYTSPMEAATTQETPTEWPTHTTVAATTQTKQSSAPYTLVDPSMMIMSSSSTPSDSDESARTTRLMAQLTSLMTPDQLEAALNETNRQIAANITLAMNTTDLLHRPPYRELAYDQEPVASDMSQPMLVLDASQSRPLVSKKLYEMFAPSVPQTFTNNQPTQRFNWSALKYLAQNLLANSPLINRFNNNATNITQSSASNARDQLQQYAIQTEDEENSAGNSTQQRLLDLMTRTGFPSNYYELLAANNTNSDPFDETKQPQQQVVNNVSQSRGIFERAGNLLQEMKQLEQKKAAALLAAFRYQVPGPLIRPWDVNSDYLQQYLSGGGGGGGNGGAAAGVARFFSDRLDYSAGGSKQQLPAAGQLLNTIKSTLFKQKFIARDELEARLNAGKARRFAEERADESQYGHNNITNTRRSDSDTNQQDANSLGDSSAQLVDQLTYILASNDSSKSDRRNSSELGGSIFESLPLKFATDNSSETQGRDFDSIDLSAERQRDNQDYLTKSKQQLISSEVMNKLRSSAPSKSSGAAGSSSSSKSNQLVASGDSHHRTVSKSTTVSSSNIQHRKSESEKRKIQDDSDEVIASTNSFECAGKMAGFYPDAGSSCRVP